MPIDAPLQPGAMRPPRRQPWGRIVAYGGAPMLIVIIMILVVGANDIKSQNGTLTAVAWAAKRTATPAQLTAKPSTKTPTPTLPPSPPTCSQIGQTWVSPEDNMVLVCVPAGDFIMGSNDGDGDEKPLHTVYLDAYWIDQTEVTNAMYALCVKAGVCPLPPNAYNNVPNFPVIWVSWDDAKAYCEWAGRRLPSEAEWEKAARGTDGRKYPWGETLSCTQANYGGVKGSCVDYMTAVGSYSSYASPYGTFDMAGNVFEWVNDWYDYSYYAVSPSNNPTGPTSGQFRGRRGGSWFSSLPTDDNVGTACRAYSLPYTRNGYVGFRCAVSARDNGR